MIVYRTGKILIKWTGQQFGCVCVFVWISCSWNSLLKKGGNFEIFVFPFNPDLYHWTLTLKIVSATTIIGLLKTWARAKTWISSKLSYIILVVLLEVLEPLEAVELAEDDSPWESKSLQGTEVDEEEFGAKVAILSLDLRLWEADDSDEL